MSFASLNLAPVIVANLQQLGFITPTAIQASAIPVVLDGKDVMAGAKTGSGKTAAFALPILQKLLGSDADGSSKALVLVPTRELAQQVQANISQYAQGLGLHCVCLYGGAAFEAQQKALAQGADILVATPGRLLDHVRKRTVDLRHIDFLVLDEADRMLDMGFKDEIQMVLKKINKQRQTLLFSATFDDNIFRFSKGLLQSPVLLEVDKRNAGNQDIEQQIYEVDDDRKAGLLCHLLRHKAWPQVLVFSRTKEGADKLATALTAAQIKAQAFHGDLSQKARDTVLTSFKNGELQALVATDVAARGLDIDELPVVINMELPFVAEDYVHRIGRTGRAGNKGLAITFFTQKDARAMEELEALLDTRLPRQWYPGFEPDLTREDDNPRLSRAAQKQRARKRALGGNTRRRR
ncbi:DEAD/DEAH box helicase [Shewanella sp. GXUN23E]|uniref:DEAD/DEAH box helicase n=1 Tax=Shewanella sp. GXUN23E TaxID=3422498 RepID=UPI003D7CE6DA